MCDFFHCRHECLSLLWQSLINQCVTATTPLPNTSRVDGDHVRCNIVLFLHCHLCLFPVCPRGIIKLDARQGTSWWFQTLATPQTKYNRVQGFFLTKARIISENLLVSFGSGMIQKNDYNGHMSAAATVEKQTTLMLTVRGSTLVVRIWRL